MGAKEENSLAGTRVSKYERGIGGAKLSPNGGPSGLIKAKQARPNPARHKPRDYSAFVLWSSSRKAWEAKRPGRDERGGSGSVVFTLETCCCSSLFRPMQLGAKSAGSLQRLCRLFAPLHPSPARNVTRPVLSQPGLVPAAPPLAKQRTRARAKSVVDAATLLAMEAASGSREPERAQASSPTLPEGGPAPSAASCIQTELLLPATLLLPVAILGRERPTLPGRRAANDFVLQFYFDRCL